MIVYAIVVCSGVVGQPVTCRVTGYPTFTSLEKCESLAARIQLKRTADAQVSLTCVKTSIPARNSV